MVTLGGGLGGGGVGGGEADGEGGSPSKLVSIWHSQNWIQKYLKKNFLFRLFLFFVGTVSFSVLIKPKNQKTNRFFASQ